MDVNKCTKGPWVAELYDEDGVLDPCVIGADCHEVAFVYRHRVDTEQTKANAELIAEAGTVTHETGLSPRQLAEQVEQLRAALTEIARSDELASYVAADALAAPARKGGE